MPPTIQYALLDGQVVGLADVQRGQKGLTCFTCEDRLIVKDGQGSAAKTDLQRSKPRRKYFSHTSNSKCHGEGPAHYRLKMDIADSVRRSLQMPPEQRNFRGRISYQCPDETYGVHCIFKGAPPSNFEPKGFEQLQLGYHDFDLLQNLAEVRTEARLAAGKTRADIAGFNDQDEPIWIIEIVRSTMSNVAIENAQATKLPLFVIDVSTLPKGNEPPYPPELENLLYITMADNVANGFYPAADVTHNVECKRKAFGMGPEDHRWSKETAWLHVSGEECTERTDCPGCEFVLLHECNWGGPDGMTCPDTAYMFQNGIDRVQMYTMPEHLANSHIPNFPNPVNPNANSPVPTDSLEKQGRTSAIISTSSRGPERPRSFQCTMERGRV